MRCDHCEYRFSWDCDDGWSRVSNDYPCDKFKLDFDTLTKNQKEAIQKILMNEKED